MAYSDNPQYRAGALEPVAGYEDVLFLIDGAGPAKTKYNTSFFGIQAIVPLVGLGQHGLFLIWTQGNAAPAGYGPLPNGCASGSIALGGSAQFVNPAGLQLNSYGFVQARFTIGNPVALTGGVLDDLDLGIANGGVNWAGLPGSNPGRFNMQDQAQSPGDSTVDPIQGANKALPATFPQANPWDLASHTEHYWFENTAPSYTIFNNAAAAITTGAIGLHLKGFRYMLTPIQAGLTDQRFVAGAIRAVPSGARRIVVIPLANPSGTVVY